MKMLPRVVHDSRPLFPSENFIRRARYAFPALQIQTPIYLRLLFVFKLTWLTGLYDRS
jgi:hypothetical protein